MSNLLKRPCTAFGAVLKWGNAEGDSPPVDECAGLGNPGPEFEVDEGSSSSEEIVKVTEIKIVKMLNTNLKYFLTLQ